MKLNLEALLSLVRLILTAVGSYLIGKSFIGTEVTTETWELWVGAVLNIVSLVWSIKSKSATIEQIQSVFRQVLVIAGGIIVAKGWLTSVAWESIVGIILLLVPYFQARTAETKVRQLNEGKIQIRQLVGAKKVA